MRNKLRIVLFFSFIILFQNLVIAQSTSQYLYKVGIVDSLYSNILRETRKIFVQLPANFNSENKQKYPVVYILDGEVFLPTVSNVLDFYSGGFMPEMILIGISNKNNRTRDLTTSTIKTMYGMPFKEKNGEASHFVKFIEEELIPYTEEKYPVTSFRTLIGHSYGGLFGIYTLLNYQDLFANYLAIDPSLDWDNQKLLQQAKEVLSEKEYKGKSLFMSLSGQLHMQNPEVTIDDVMQDSSDFTLFARSNILFSNLVKEHAKNGLFFSWKFYPKELHGTISFPSIMDGLKSVFEWFQMENTDKFNSPDTPKDELYNFVEYRAKKLQDHFGYIVPPYPEDLLNMLGYMNLDMQQPAKSKMFFEFAIEYYPESANAYDSMSDFYEKQNDKVNALKYAGKAYELSGDDSYKEKIEKLKSK